MMYQFAEGTQSVSLIMNRISDMEAKWITIVSSDGCAYHSYMRADEAMSIIKSWNERGVACVLVKITDSEYL